MLLSKLYTDVGYFIGDPSALRNTLILEMANLKYMDLFRKYKTKFALRSSTITTADGVYEYYLPGDYYKPFLVTERTNDQYLRHITYKELKQKYPDPTAIPENVPTHYAPKKLTWVDAQNTTACKLHIYSSSASDTGYLSIVGRVSGRTVVELFAITGVTHKDTTNTWDIGGIISISSGTVPVGTITVLADADATTILTLNIGITDEQKMIAQLYPTADATYTMYLDYYALPPRLVNASDLILIPRQYEDWLVYATAAEILLIDGRKEAGTYFGLAKSVLELMQIDEVIEEDEQWSMWCLDSPEQGEF